ncbi:hypothetical protein N7510_003830 [Penicillium lagena]|uniref:uncharacterized protein n=1 Tax=Penicillium lagena TaxID=94218 RepID=UPI002540B085|nr:uncharacterized protein N7510_003830 [Penicillium lagena]KAJ5619846.1 hypothetical protein N7510_003830 [Penicillium lagena]
MQLAQTRYTARKSPSLLPMIQRDEREYLKGKIDHPAPGHVECNTGVTSDPWSKRDARSHARADYREDAGHCCYYWSSEAGVETLQASPATRSDAAVQGGGGQKNPPNHPLRTHRSGGEIDQRIKDRGDRHLCRVLHIGINGAWTGLRRRPKAATVSSWDTAIPAKLWIGRIR